MSNSYSLEEGLELHSEIELQPQPHTQTEIDFEIGLPSPRCDRCHVCKKKTRLMSFTCRCNLHLCIKHRYPEDHDCQFDHKGIGQQKIQEKNPVIAHAKLEKI